MNTIKLPAELPGTLDYTHEGTSCAGYDPIWEDYAVTLTLRGRERRIASLTVYPDGYALVTKSASVRGSTEHAAWNNLVRALGGTPERVQAMYCNRPTI